MKKILIFILCFMLCSCYDYKELNNIRIIDYMYIDYDDSYSFTLHEVNNDDEFNVSMNELNNNNDLFLGHIKYIYLSDNLCRKGILDILNYIYRNNNFSNNYILLIGDNTDSDKYGLNSIDVYKYILDKHKDIGIYNVNNNMLGYFDDDKLIGYIDDKIYKFIMFNEGYDIYDNNNVISIYDRNIKIDKDTIYIKCYGMINSTDYNIYNYDELSNKISNILTDKINNYIDTTFESGSNLFGVSNNYKIYVEVTINKNGNTV